MKTAMYRLNILLTVLLFGAIASSAQLRVTLNISSRPDPYLSNWAQRRDMAVVTVINSTGSDIQGKFSCRINKDGSFLARTKPESMRVISFPPGTSQYFGDELVPMENTEVAEGTVNTSVRTGMLPGGLYEFCVSILNPTTNEVISQPVCRTITIRSYQAPILLLPADKSEIAFGSRPMLRWTSVSPRPDFVVSYRVKVFEVMAGQTPINAFRVNKPILDVSDVTATQLLWPPDFEMPRAGQQYIWTVRATDDRGTALGEPDGYATPFTFSTLQVMSRGGDEGAKKSGGGDTTTFAKKSGGSGENTGNKTKSAGTGNQGIDTALIDSNPPGQPCGTCGTAVVLTDTLVGSQPVAVNDSLVVGKFMMKVTEVTNSAPGSAAGKGEIVIPWLLARVKVTFDNIVVNASRRVVAGQVSGEVDASAPQYPQQWAINQVTSWNWVKNTVAAVDQWVKGNGQLVKQVNSMNTPLKLPLGFNNVKGYTLCISEMKFMPTEAVMASVATLPLTKLDDTLSFGLKQLPICPEGVGKSGRLELLQDIDIRGITSSQPTFTIAAKAKSGSRPGCYITWGCDNNSDTMSLDIDVMFPRAWMTPRPDADTTKQSIATLRGKTIDWKEWMLIGNLPSATFAGTNGLGLQIDTMAFDFSDLENAPGMTFPANYVGTQDITFNGFYAKQIKMFMPDGWRTFADSNAAPQFIAQNLIINKNGFTGTMLAANVIMFPSMNLNRLGASVDTVKVVMLNSNLTQAYMRGRMLLPVTDSTPQNAIMYKALFNNVQKTFDFSMQPQNDIEMKLFGNAKLKIEATSTLTMALKKGRKKFLINLNGEAGWNDATLQVGAKTITLDLAPDFENMRMSFDDSLSKPFGYDAGDWSFASPQKKLAKFPITIDKVKFDQATAQGNELFRGKLAFDVVVALDSNRIGGRGSFEVIGAVEKTTSNANFKFKPKFVDFNVGKIIVFANLPAVQMNGELNFYNSDPTWGNGFAATIQAKFKEMQMQLDAAARFGSKVDNNVRYRYWYASAKAILPPPGIVFLPGYAFYGFGVAAWRKVNVNMLPAQPNINAVAAAGTTTTSATSGATMVPDRTVAFGFRAMAVLGTAPDPKKMNADIALFGQFNNSGGMSYIGLQGDLWLQAKLLERASAPVKGTLNIVYDFTTKIFDLNAGVIVNKSPITGNANLNIHIEGKTGIWWVKLGDPSNRNVLNVNVFNTNINSNSYFMFGKNISPPSGFTSRTNNGLAAAGCYGMSPSAAGTTDAIAGNGFAGGADLGFDTGDRSKHLFGRVNVKWRFGGGMEFNASFLRYPEGSLCGQNGYNWWYFRANAAAWANASCGIEVEKGKVYCKNGCYWGLASLKFGAWAQAGFPNSSWVEGQASGTFDFLSGVVKGSFNVEFDMGNKCYPAAPAATTTAAQDVAAEQKNQLVKSITPAVPAYNVALTEPVMVVYNFVPGASFELQEMTGGASGNTINRTFQVTYTVGIDEKDGATWKPLTLQSTKDALGAYLFRKKKSIVFNPINTPISNAKTTFGGKGGGSSPAPESISVGGLQFTTQVSVPPSPPPTLPIKGVAAPKNPGTYLLDPEKPAPTPTESDNFSFDNSGTQNFISATADWEKSKTYRVTVVGTLWELVSGNWVVAKDRATNQDVKQTVTQNFSTPFDPVAIDKNVKPINSNK
ncbi:MAG: hypothetical protein FGM33_09850 [Candidatus Kapabacteria bacterium]|nr:hypothetical protein [Candidatus Kapabacteria bacterium]